MRKLDFKSLSPDCVVCACDGFNYISDEDDLLRLFYGIYDALPEGGVLVFDLSSYYKLSNVLGDNTFTLVEDDIAYIWENYYEPDAETVEMEITFLRRRTDYTRDSKNITFRRRTEMKRLKQCSAPVVSGALRRLGTLTWRTPPKGLNGYFCYV
jgi:hypothetical protein